MTEPVSRFRFTSGTPAEVRKAIEPHLQKWEFLVPGWCREVNITWCDDDVNGALNIVVHYEYRRADLHVLPNFLSCKERRERNVVHELLHIVTQPLQNTCGDMRDVLKTHVPELEGWANEMIRHSDEAVTCDLTDVLFAKLYDCEPK